MMGKLRWYKRDPAAALEGMSNLSLEERGAYNTVLDLIYARDGAVDDDARFIAGWLRCDVRVWKRIRARLIDLGKLYLSDGSLRNSRADAEVDRGLSMVASSSEAGKASARKRNADKSKNNEIASTTASTTASTNSTSTTRKKDSEAKASDAGASADAPCRTPIFEDTTHELWNEGVAILCQLGMQDRPARSNIGRWLRDAKNDAAVVLSAIQRARDARTGDPIPFVTQCIKTGPQRRKSKDFLELSLSIDDHNADFPNPPKLIASRA